MYRKILVPLDGSNAAEIVIPYVEELAAKLGADIVVTSVYESTDDMIRLHRYYLERMVDQILSQIKEFNPIKPIKIQSEVLQGKPAKQLLRFADTTNISLIAMASYGSSGREAKLLGNIAIKVLWSTTKPVLLIRTPAEDTLIKDKRLIRKILVPLDGSKTGETIIECAEVLAEALGAELVLLQVLEPLRIVAGFESVAPSSIPQGEESIKASATDYLDKVEKPLKQKGIKTSVEIVWGSAAERIIEYAESNNVDLITISSRGLSGVGRWVLGSVTEKVLQSGDKPVLVARPLKS
jgi:nucleotide-binding universal stress UspA family protein